MSLTIDILNILREYPELNEFIKTKASDYYNYLIKGREWEDERKINALISFCEQLKIGKFPLSMSLFGFVRLLLLNIMHSVEIKNRGSLFRNLFVPDALTYFPRLQYEVHSLLNPLVTGREYFGFANASSREKDFHYCWYAIKGEDNGKSVEKFSELQRWLDDFNLDPKGRVEETSLISQLADLSLKPTKVYMATYFFDTGTIFFAETMRAKPGGDMDLSFKKSEAKRQQITEDLIHLLTWKPW